MGKIPLIQTCYNLANVLGCCCNYNDIREIMMSNEREWYEKCDRNTPVVECWYRYFMIRNKEREKSENEKK